MRKVKVTIEVDLKNDEKGFIIVPTNEEDLLNGKYVVRQDPRNIETWACKNSVTLKE
jgi:hypothetical protein